MADQASAAWAYNKLTKWRPVRRRQRNRHRHALDALQIHEDGHAVPAGDLEFAGISLIANLNSRITALEAIIEALVGDITPAEND